jgi:hypothetical protein
MSCCSISHRSTILVAGITRPHKLSPNNSLLYNALDGGFQVLLDQCNGRWGSGGHVASRDLPRPRDPETGSSISGDNARHFLVRYVYSMLSVSDHGGCVRRR